MSLPSKYLLWYHDGLPPLAVSPVVIFFHEKREQDKNQRDNTVEQSLTHELVRKAKKKGPWENFFSRSPTLNWKKFSGSSWSSCKACICFDKVVCQRSKAFTFCFSLRWPWYDVVFCHCKSHESPMGVPNALFYYGAFPYFFFVFIYAKHKSWEN